MERIYICGQSYSESKKGKVVPVLNLIKHYAMKAYGGVDVDPHFLDLGTSWR
jgi:hypothetical protein